MSPLNRKQTLARIAGLIVIAFSTLTADLAGQTATPPESTAAIAVATAATSPAAESPAPASTPAARPSILVVPFEFAAPLEQRDKKDRRKHDENLPREVQTSTNMARAVADLLTAELLETRQFRVLEGSLVSGPDVADRVGGSGLPGDTTSLLARARALGARYVVTGSIVMVGKESSFIGGALGKLSGFGGLGVGRNSYNIGLAARVVDTATGEVISASRTDGTARGGGKLGVLGGGSEGAALFTIGKGGEREKKLGESLEHAVAGLVGQLVQARLDGQLQP